MLVVLQQPPCFAGLGVRRGGFPGGGAHGGADPTAPRAQRRGRPAAAEGRGGRGFLDGFGFGF